MRRPSGIAKNRTRSLSPTLASGRSVAWQETHPSALLSSARPTSAARVESITTPFLLKMRIRSMFLPRPTSSMIRCTLDAWFWSIMKCVLRTIASESCSTWLTAASSRSWRCCLTTNAEYRPSTTARPTATDSATLSLSVRGIMC